MTEGPLTCHPGSCRWSPTRSCTRSRRLSLPPDQDSRGRIRKDPRALERAVQGGRVPEAEDAHKEGGCWGAAPQVRWYPREPRWRETERPSVPPRGQAVGAHILISEPGAGGVRRPQTTRTESGCGRDVSRHRCAEPSRSVFPPRGVVADPPAPSNHAARPAGTFFFISEHFGLRHVRHRAPELSEAAVFSFLCRKESGGWGQSCSRGSVSPWPPNPLRPCRLPLLRQSRDQR